MPLIPAQYAFLTADIYVYVAVGVLGVLGGLLFGAYAEQIIDLVFGVLGAILVSQGAVNLAVENLPAFVLDLAKLTTYYTYYVGGLAALLLALRCVMVGAREGEPKKVTTTPSPTKGAKGKPGARPGSKVSPAGAVGGKGKPKGKSMY